MKRRDFIKSGTAAASAGLVGGLPLSCSNQRRPNVLLILTDDQGWDDLGCHGNTVLDTPRLDRFARESVQFANFYVTPVCAPTRASLLTGRHFLRTGVSHVHGGRDFVHPDEVMLGQMFQGAGYRTGTWGKWHSGKTTGYLPWERGFHEAYKARLYRHENSVGQFNGEDREHTGWTVDTLTDYAIDFIERNRDRPWFAYVPYLTVHAPLRTDEKLIAKYEKRGVGRMLAAVYGMLEQLDHNVGRLLDRLDELELADNTVVLFLSDNGPQFFDDMPEKDRKIRYVSAYKGHKGSMWENGIKAPLFMRYGKRFTPHTVQRLADVCDIFPTLMDLCGIPITDDQPRLDGRSIRPWLEGDEQALPPRESVIFSNIGWPPQKNEVERRQAADAEYAPIPPDRKAQTPFEEQLCGLRTEEHKLLYNPGFAPGAPEKVDRSVLIDIRRDPREDVNLAAASAPLAARMESRLRGWFEQVMAEPHSFHTPVFAVGPGTTNAVPTYAPLRLQGGVVNRALATHGWRTPGDGGEYLIDVREAGLYRLTLSCRDKKGTVRLRAMVDDESVECDVAQTEETALGSLRLAAGQRVLRLSVASASTGAELADVRSVVFERVEA